MKHKHFLLLLLWMVLLSSCMKGDFSALSSSLERTVKVIADIPSDSMRLKLDLSDKDASYTFHLSSPNDLLKWEGKLQKEDEFFVSESLLITPGTFLPEGEYKLVLNSNAGGSKDISLSVPAVESFRSLEEMEENPDVKISYLDEEGRPLSDKEGSVTALCEYFDRYKNKISVTISL